MTSRIRLTYLLEMKVTLTLIICVLLSGALTSNAEAQLAPLSTKLNYSFSMPIAKIIPNTCSGGLELITGDMDLRVTTTNSSSGFTLEVDYMSSGQADDALADGTLILDGTQKPRYNYSSEASISANFAQFPSNFGATVPITDFLVRASGNTSDLLTVNTIVDINFANGIPTAPVIKQIDVRCN